MGKTSKRYGAVVAAGAVTMMLGTSCGVFVREPAPDAVVIGVDLALTGDGEDLGAVFRDAIELRVEQINQLGVLGERRLELLVKDNRSDQSTAAANLTELAADPSVTAIITGACDACLLAAVDGVNNSGVPTISLGRADDVATPVAERRYIFKLGPDANPNAVVLSRELELAEVETIALVNTTDRYGEDGLREMGQAADRAEFEVAVTAQIDADEESVPEAAADVAEQIIAYSPVVDPTLLPSAEVGEPPSGPDAVVVWAPANVAGEVAVALRNAEYDGPLYFDAFAADELFLVGEQGAATDGATMVFTETLAIDEAIAISPAKTARQNWFRTYTARLGTYHAYSSFAADAVNVIVDAINRFDTAEPERVRNALETTLLDGLTGPIRFTTDNHSGLSSQGLTVVVARGDRWHLAG